MSAREHHHAQPMFAAFVVSIGRSCRVAAVIACAAALAACGGLGARSAADQASIAPEPMVKAAPDVVAAVDAAAAKSAQATPPSAGTLRQEYDPSVMMRGKDAVRTVRLRLRDRAGTWERWLLKTQVFAREGDAWRQVDGADTLLYEGKPLSDSLHSRYGGAFMIAPGRMVVLMWQGGLLLARFPDGTTRQVFLASPTEEAPRKGHDDGELHFTLSDDGRPATMTLVRNGQVVWRATRSAPE